MDHMDVVGRHVLLFDDDATSAFVNSMEALVPWNDDPSLLIDRYDVRHLLQQLPHPLSKRRQRQQHHLEPDGVSRSDLDLERYLDLPHLEDDDRDDEEEEGKKGAEVASSGAYQAVPFSYSNTDISGDRMNSDHGLKYSGYHPPFPVPESLLSNLPPTEKVHQIMSRTATFVSKHGGQSEIVLRVKQGDNPTFGFLMPDHHLHPYFRFLVDHPELSKTVIDPTDRQEEKKKSANGENESHIAASGALSLLGSVYGSGEDDEGALQVASDSKETEPHNSEGAVTATVPHRYEQVSSTNKSEEVRNVVKHPTVANENTLPLEKNQSANAATTGAVRSKTSEVDTGSLNVSMNRSQASMSDPGPLILEPPSFLKRMVDKVVEFILRNGKEFEAVLIEQDRTNGRFPFLLPSSHYHSYYLKVLQDARESNLPGKNHVEKKIDSSERASSTGKVQETLIKGSAADARNMAKQLEGSYELDKKEKFKMVIGGSKKDAHDLPPKPAKQAGLSAEAAAAIVMAATRGPSGPTKIDASSKTSVDDSGTGLSIGEGDRSSSLGSFSSFFGHNSISKTVSNSRTGTSLTDGLFSSVRQSSKEGCSTTSDVLVANAIVKTVAGEADSSEACLTREQKQKAERLKRAKMFAAMVKSGLHGTSKLLPTSIRHGGSQVVAAGSILPRTESDLAGREREGSSVPLDAEVSDTADKSQERASPDDHSGEHTSRKDKSRSRHHEEDSEGEHKHSRKRHRSKHLAHSKRDDHRHKHRHSSRDDHKHKHRHSSRDDHKHKSHSSSKDRTDHSSSEDEHLHSKRSGSQHHHKHHSSADDEYGQKSSHRHHKKSRSERKQEISDKSDASISDHSKEVSLDFSTDLRELARPSVSEAQPSVATVVPDDLRAKVRAMLLETM